MMDFFAILHEGNEKKTNDNKLLKLLIEHLNLDIKKVKFLGMGSKSNFFNLNNIIYKNIKFDIYDHRIKKILFVVDADYEKNDSKYGGSKNTRKELKYVIKELELEKYSNIFITCNPQSQDGYLESLILSTIPSSQKKCIEDFLFCSNFSSKENHKSILNQIYKTAYPQAPFDFSHKNFDELKEKLKDLFDE